MFGTGIESCYDIHFVTHIPSDPSTKVIIFLTSFQVRQLLLDPAVQREFRKMRADADAKAHEAKLLHQELSAVAFSQESKTGRMLMAKCRTLQVDHYNRVPLWARLLMLGADIHDWYYFKTRLSERTMPYWVMCVGGGGAGEWGEQGRSWARGSDSTCTAAVQRLLQGGHDHFNMQKKGLLPTEEVLSLPSAAGLHASIRKAKPLFSGKRRTQ